MQSQIIHTQVPNPSKADRHGTPNIIVHSTIGVLRLAAAFLAFIPFVLLPLLQPGAQIHFTSQYGIHDIHDTGQLR